MKQAVVPAQDENIRLTELEDCEHKIQSALRRGLEATVQIGLQLKKINDRELYLERGETTFDKYCVKYQRLDPRSAGRFIDISQSYHLLKAAGLPLPDNESQVAELSRLEPDQQPAAWKRVLDAAEQREEPVTIELVKTAVDQAKAAAAPSATVPKDGARGSLDEPDLDLGSDLSEAESERSKSPTGLPRIQLSEDGEEALERIRRTCGDAVATSIEYQTLKIPEKELILWNEEKDPARLVYAISSLGYSVAKAKTFVDQTISGSTRVSRLILLAQVNGGNYRSEFEHAVITVSMPSLG